MKAREAIGVGYYPQQFFLNGMICLFCFDAFHSVISHEPVFTRIPSGDDDLRSASLRLPVNPLPADTLNNLQAVGERGNGRTSQ